MAVASILIDMNSPTVDIRKDAAHDKSCECIWFNITTTNSLVNLQLAFANKADVAAFVGLLQLAAGIK